MRATLPTIAALAAGGLLLGRQASKNHRSAAAFSVDPVAERDLHMRMPVGAAIAALAAVAAGGVLLSRQLRKGAGEACSVEESIELEVPVSTAYNQWTQFEEFPKFMATVKEVKQVDDTHLHWRAVVGGKTKEWDSEITEQIPDQRIAWRSVDGTPNGGVVTFHKIAENRTRVMLQMDYQPESFTEKLGDVVGAVKLTAKGNLKRFKHLVEERGSETGAWRGTVTQH